MNINTAVGEIRTHYLNLPKDDLTEGGRFTAEVLEKLVATERAKILSEVEGWLVDEEIEKVKVSHVSARRGFYIKTKDPSAYVRNKLRAELVAKLNQLKEGK